MRIAVFGGSFNPVHLGHVKMVRYLCENLNFEKIIVIPAGIPAHKESYSVSGNERYHMCRLAFEDFPKVEISRIEIDSPKICYTIDTLMKLKILYKDAIFYEIIGEDSANSFHTWKDFEKLLQESQVMVFRRTGEKGDLDKRFMILEAPYFPYSSTEVRNYLGKKFRSGNLEQLKKMLPERVLSYIFKKKLYNTAEGE